MKNFIYVIIMTFYITSSYAGSEGSGKITKIGGQMKNGVPMAYFGLETPATVKPDCSHHKNYHYGVDLSTEEGKAVYALILSAHAQGLKLQVGGSGLCLPSFDVEMVQYWYFWGK